MVLSVHFKRTGNQERLWRRRLWFLQRRGLPVQPFLRFLQLIKILTLSAF